MILVITFAWCTNYVKQAKSCFNRKWSKIRFIYSYILINTWIWQNLEFQGSFIKASTSSLKWTFFLLWISLFLYSQFCLLVFARNGAKWFVIYACFFTAYNNFPSSPKYCIFNFFIMQTYTRIHFMLLALKNQLNLLFGVVRPDHLTSGSVVLSIRTEFFVDRSFNHGISKIQVYWTDIFPNLIVMYHFLLSKSKISTGSRITALILFQ